MTRFILAAGLVLSALMLHAQPPQQKPPGIEERLKRTSEVIQPAVQPNAEQQKVITAAYKKFFTAADKLTGNKPPDPQNQELRKKLEALEKEWDASIKKALTADQYKKYETAAKSLVPERPGGKKGEGPPPPKNK